MKYLEQNDRKKKKKLQMLILISPNIYQSIIMWNIHKIIIIIILKIINFNIIYPNLIIYQIITKSLYQLAKLIYMGQHAKLTSQGTFNLAQYSEYSDVRQFRRVIKTVFISEKIVHVKMRSECRWKYACVPSLTHVP